MISSSDMQRLLVATLVASALTFGGVVTPRTASAQDAVERHIALLKRSDDFRVRTQAALALGASKDKRALVPLCHALDDGNRTVRIASASALGRLRLGGKGCLERRLSVEDQEAVKSSIQRALEAVGGASAEEAAPTIDGSTKYYVALGKVVNASPEHASKVRANMTGAARELGGYAVAPENETQAQAQALLKKHPKVKAFYLAPTLTPPSYEGGNLTIRISVAMLSYPDKVMLGQFSVKLTQEGVSGKNPQAELELVGMAAESAMKKFAKHAGALGS
ncbi:MAG: HEAT repeat domain-containing protein [Myxococcales bacterium]|nr:HEAT repeat domain-containing protein [Myxococcales bacterium]